jgi:hypothetical protein
MKLSKTLLLALTAISAMAGDVDAQNQRAGVVTVATGSVSVARSSAPSTPLKFRDDVFVHDRIATGERSLARILLGGKAVVTVGERSVVTITEVPGRSTIDLAGGRISLAVARERMKSGDVVEIRTPLAVAGVRGTVVIAEVVPGRDATSPAVSRFTVLKGLVEVSPLDLVTRRPIAKPALLGAHQTLVADRRGVSAPQPITKDAADRLGNEFRTAPAPPPGDTNAMVTESQMQTATEHARAFNAPDDDRRERRLRGDRGRRLKDGDDGPDRGDSRLDARKDAKPDVRAERSERPDIPQIELPRNVPRPSFDPPRDRDRDRDRGPRREREESRRRGRGRD